MVIIGNNNKSLNLLFDFKLSTSSWKLNISVIICMAGREKLRKPLASSKGKSVGQLLLTTKHSLREQIWLIISTQNRLTVFVVDAR